MITAWSRLASFYRTSAGARSDRNFVFGMLMPAKIAHADFRKRTSACSNENSLDFTQIYIGETSNEVLIEQKKIIQNFALLHFAFVQFKIIPINR